MRRLPDQTAVEWVFIVCLIVVCAVLSGFQYRWTSEVGRATTERLRSDFDGQVQLLGRAFDTELADACNQLLPENEPLNGVNREAVHAARLQRWQARKPRPIFRRLALAVPENGALPLYALDQTTRRLTRVAWPAEWDNLRDNLARKAAAGSGPPFQETTGTPIEFPIFRDHLENEWMIFDLDLDYIGKRWLPELVTKFLDQDRQSTSEATVRPFLRPDMIIFTTGQHITDPGTMTVSVRFNGQGWGTENRNRRGENDFWELTARQSPRALESIVARARWRNFILACLLNGLTLAAGLALLRYAKRARRVSALHMRFVANTSHELRTPLAVIQVTGENLQRGVTRDPDRLKQYGAFIVQHAQRLNRLVEDMLELADVRRLSSVSQRQVIHIQNVLESAIAVTLPETRAAGCKVEAYLPSGLPQVLGDEAALRRAFQNLIHNAAKYAAAGGWIGVKADVAADGAAPVVEVRIEDRGPGISHAEQAHIFEPFSRGIAAREQRVQGSGLGLSMVFEIVQTHGGTITVQSTPDRGTIFSVRLPALTKKAR